MTQRESVRSLAALSLVLAVLTLYRFGVMVHNELPLFLDEAQYWAWSLDPAWGYYSKPPMVAWIIAMFSVFGQGEVAIRLGSLLLYPLTAVMIYMLGYRMFGTRVALWAGILFASLPLVGFNSLFITTDAPLLFFWGVASYALWGALNDNRWGDWLLLGVAVGLGMLSKYSMIIFAPSVALILAMPAYRKHWFNPRLYVAALLSVLIFSPNLWWNAQFDFVTLRHTADISRLDERLFHPARWARFFSGQFATMGPIAFSFLLIALASPSVWKDRKLSFLASLTVPFIVVISLQALLAKANINWAAPTYFAGSLLVVARWCMHERKRWYVAAVLLNLVLLSGFYHYHFLANTAGIKLTRQTDPYGRVLGWPQVGQELRQVLAQYPDAKVAVTGRHEFALLSYYAQLYPDRLRMWNPKGEKLSHFHVFSDMKQDIGDNFIFASPHPLNSSIGQAFESWSALGTLSVPLYENFSLKLHLYRGVGFKGYQ